MRNMLESAAHCVAVHTKRRELLAFEASSCHLLDLYGNVNRVDKVTDLNWQVRMTLWVNWTRSHTQTGQ